MVFFSSLIFGWLLGGTVGSFCVISRDSGGGFVRSRTPNRLSQSHLPVQSNNGSYKKPIDISDYEYKYHLQIIKEIFIFLIV